MEIQNFDSVMNGLGKPINDKSVSILGTPIHVAGSNQYILVSQARDDLGRFANDPNNLNTDLNRTSLRADTKQKIVGNYTIRPDGTAIHNKTREVIKPPFHFGHKYGWENRRIIAAADSLNWDQAKLNNYVNAKGHEFINLENATDNLSHKGEKPGNSNLEEIITDMKKYK